MKNQLFPLLATVACAALSFNAQAVVIDDFDTNQTVGVTQPGSASSQVLESGGDILGGYRDIYVESSNATAFTFMGMNVPTFGAQVENGRYTQFSLFGASGFTFTTWDGDDNDATPDGINFTGLGGIDLTDSGAANAFGIEIFNNDQAGAPIEFTVYSSATAFSSFTFAVPEVNMTSTVADVLFTSFVAGPGALTAADFSNVGAVTMLVDGRGSSTGRDVSLNILDTRLASAVPVPGSISLLAAGFALFGFGLRRRAS